MSLEKSVQKSPFIIKGEKKNMHGVHVEAHRTSRFVMALTWKLVKNHQSFLKMRKKVISPYVDVDKQEIHHFVTGHIQNYK